MIQLFCSSIFTQKYENVCPYKSYTQIFTVASFCINQILETSESSSTVKKINKLRYIYNKI